MSHVADDLADFRVDEGGDGTPDQADEGGVESDVTPETTPTKDQPLVDDSDSNSGTLHVRIQ